MPYLYQLSVPVSVGMLIVENNGFKKNNALI
jgi:hypothetical protein